MTAIHLGAPLALPHGPALKNRFVLAPMTNMQSGADGILSDDEYHWLTLRAKGGFGMTMTCAAHVQANGQGFAGQLGIFGDEHLAGLTRLAKGLKDAGSNACVQLHHAGIRAPKDLISDLVGPSQDAETGARALTTAEVEQLRDDFIAAAVRADTAGFDGVEVHAAHGYVLAQFLAVENNRRDDSYGGSLDNRARLTFEIIDGIRRACRPDFQIGVRLSPERFGMQLPELREVAARLMHEQLIDYIDLSLWDAFKYPDDAAFAGRTLLSYFTDLPRGKIALGAAGKITNGTDAARLLEAGCDFAVIGKSGIICHDFANRVLSDPAYCPPELPVSAEHLQVEGLGPVFIGYLRNWPGFIAAEQAA